MAIFHYLLLLTTTNPKLKDFPFFFPLLLLAEEPAAFPCRLNGDPILETNSQLPNKIVVIDYFRIIFALTESCCSFDDSIINLSIFRHNNFVPHSHSDVSIIVVIWLS